MLSIVLHKHLDEMDVIDEQVKAEIDKILSLINKDELIKDPHKALIDAVEEVKNMLMDKYQTEASKNGYALAGEIKKRDVIVDSSKIPTENA